MNNSNRQTIDHEHHYRHLYILTSLTCINQNDTSQVLSSIKQSHDETRIATHKVNLHRPLERDRYRKGFDPAPS